MSPATANHPSVMRARGRAAASPAPRWQQAEQHAEHEHEDEAEPERRHRLPEGGETARDIVERAPAPDRRIDADGQRDGDHDEHGEAAQLEGGGIPLGDEVHGGTAEAHRAAEVALNRAAREAPVLDGPRAIETEGGAHQLDVLLRGLRRIMIWIGSPERRTSAKTTTDTTNIDTSDCTSRPIM